MFFLIFEIRKKPNGNTCHSHPWKLRVHRGNADKNIGEPNLFGSKKIGEEKDFIQVADACPYVGDDGDAYAVALNYAHESIKNELNTPQFIGIKQIYE